MNFLSLFQTVKATDLQVEVLADKAYGVIEVRDQELYAIHFRPYPKLVSIAEIQWGNLWKRSSGSSRCDRVLLFYNQPMFHRNFLALKYFVSDYKSSLASIAVCLSVLDYVAKVKRTDAAITEITNNRIKDRHLSHFGWEEHLQQRKGRHWIKRFYGEYPGTFLFQEMLAPGQQHKEVHPQLPNPSVMVPQLERSILPTESHSPVN